MESSRTGMQDVKDGRGSRGYGESGFQIIELKSFIFHISFPCSGHPSWLFFYLVCKYFCVSFLQSRILVN